MQTTFPASLIRKYDRPGPRYTSYPTALEFSEKFGPEAFETKVRENNRTAEKPLSLYFHLPFCKQVCYFCACNAIYTGKRERAVPYVDQLILELEMTGALVHPGREVTQLHWGGGTPTFLLPELMAKLQNATKRRFKFSADAEISVEVDPREASAEHMATLAEIGFNRVSLGVQDFHPDVQEAVNRIQPYEVTAGTVEMARRHGFKSVNIDLMYGLPRQTMQRLDETLAKTIGLRPDRIAFFNYAYLPDLKKHMRRIDPGEIPSPEVKLAMLERAVSVLTDAGYRYIGMDHFVLPTDELAIALDQGVLHRNFQGYTTRAGAELYGFGVTAISDLGDAYSQNLKTETQYYARLEKGELPTQRGIRLTADDLLRRDVIMSLINRFEVDLAAVSAQHGVAWEPYFGADLAALRTFEEDGLVSRAGARVKVEPQGRFLIRNICMTFDAYMAKKAAEAKRFSRTV